MHELELITFFRTSITGDTAGVLYGTLLSYNVNEMVELHNVKTDLMEQYLIVQKVPDQIIFDAMRVSTSENTLQRVYREYRVRKLTK